MPYPFLGNTARTYTQFWDLAADTPLIAEPGGSYDMAPVGGLTMPVPPGDGLWGPELQHDDSEDSGAGDAPGKPAVPLTVLTGSQTETEEN